MAHIVKLSWANVSSYILDTTSFFHIKTIPPKTMESVLWFLEYPDVVVGVRAVGKHVDVVVGAVV